MVLDHMTPLPPASPSCRPPPGSRRRPRRGVLLGACALLALLPPGQAQGAAPPAAAVPGNAAAPAAPAAATILGAGPPTSTLRAPVVTRHVGRFQGRKVAYTATVDGIDVADAQGRHGARVVAFAYTADSVAGRAVEPARRPVMFFFNGGPIVASPYLHMGAYGPRRVEFPEDPQAEPFTWALKDNPHSLLDVADLVFIDPAGTGFSRVAPGKNPRDYWSIVADGQQVSAFIAAWLRRHGRLGSPKFVFGESYGTHRAAEVGRQLASLPEPVLLDGIVLFGQAVNIVEYSQRPRNIVSYVVSLPTLAATAWHFGKVDRQGRTLEQFIQAARDFARDEYLVALYRGNTLPQPDRERVARGLEAFSGIPAAWYLEHELRITKERYRVELLKDRGLLLGRNDSRYTAPLTDQGGGPDPSNVLPKALESAFHDHLRHTLKVDWDEPYVISAPVGGLDDWDWGAKTPFSDWPYVDSIAFLLEKHPTARVMFGTGYHDTQTTIGSAEYAAALSGWPKERTWVREYPGGHMAYTIDASARALGADLRAFMSGAR
jgi:carboxypeptidase C (cathepsin A)